MNSVVTKLFQFILIIGRFIESLVKVVVSTEFWLVLAPNREAEGPESENVRKWSL